MFLTKSIMQLWKLCRDFATESIMKILLKAQKHYKNYNFCQNKVLSSLISSGHVEGSLEKSDRIFSTFYRKHFA